MPQKGGLSVNRKQKEQLQRAPDLTSTSGARRYLDAVRKNGTPEQVSDAEKRISEQLPDMLIERR